MTENDQGLGPAELAAAGLDDWRPILGRLKAAFDAPDLAASAALAARVAELAAPGEASPVLTLTRRSASVAVGRGTIGNSEIELARSISAAASELGLTAAPGRIVQLELGLDTAAGAHLAEFYAALLGVEVRDGEPVDPAGELPTLWWQSPADADPDAELPGQPFDQRWHFDVWVGADEGPRRVEAVLAAGGRLVSDRAAPAYWVVEDADGNRSCICTAATR